MKLLGLCGYARSGKDTAAKHMPGWKRFAFADALKADLVSLLGDVGCDLDLPEHKERARSLLVAWGATARAFRPDYWIDRLFRAINFWHQHTHGKFVVITDVRYPNEVDAILRSGGTVVRIQRPGVGPANAEEDRSIREIIMAHPELPVVTNDGTPEELGDEVLAAADEEASGTPCSTWSIGETAAARTKAIVAARVDAEARAEELTQPLAGPEDMAGGWTLDTRFLHMLQRMVQNENGGPGMEDIEAVLVHAPKAIERWKALRDSGKEEPNG